MTTAIGFTKRILPIPIVYGITQGVLSIIKIPVQK